MELHPVQWPLEVLHRHHHPIVTPGGDYQRVGDRVGGERQGVIASHSQFGSLGAQEATVGTNLHLRCATMNGSGSPHHFGSKCLTDRLMT